jgi:hypothetical protein
MSDPSVSLGYNLGVNFPRSSLAADRHVTHDDLRAGDLANLGLHDRSGGDHVGFGVLCGETYKKAKPELPTLQPAE